MTSKQRATNILRGRVDGNGAFPGRCAVSSPPNIPNYYPRPCTLTGLTDGEEYETFGRCDIFASSAEFMGYFPVNSGFCAAIGVGLKLTSHLVVVALYRTRNWLSRAGAGLSTAAPAAPLRPGRAPRWVTRVLG